jgi:glutamyl-tRNA reductase
VPSSPIVHPVPVPLGSDRPEEGGTVAVPWRLVGLEFSLETASLDELETVARGVDRDAIRRWAAERKATEEVGLVSTCHRVELFVLVRERSEADRWREVLPGDARAWRVREGREAIVHLFRVAAGRQSLAVGELEVREQVRVAAHSIESRHPRPVLRELFLGAVSAADRDSAQPWGARSIAAVAAERLLGHLERPWPSVLVIGSGTVGRQVADALASRARITIVYHRRPPDDGFLARLRARAVPLDQLPAEFPNADGIVTAAKFGTRGLRAIDLPRGRRMVLVDLGVPRNIDPDVRALADVRLIDLEELHGLSVRTARDAADDAEVEASAIRFAEVWERRLHEPAVGAIRRSAEAVRRDELEHARSFLGDLSPSQRAAIDRLTQRLVARLLLAPTERIRALPTGPDGDARRRLAAELLAPGATDP